MIDEGYVKYELDWREAPALPEARLVTLNAWRNRLHDAGLIGHDRRHDVGFGNISVRDGDGFIISGTQTGHIARTGADHYCRVTGYDIDGNTLRCEGPVKASSEALTHAAIYELDPAIGAVVHVHSAGLWREWKDRLPTTSPRIAYGTPDMAREFRRLYRRDGNRETDASGFADTGIAVMAGHADGLIAFGTDLDEAGGRILALQERSDRGRGAAGA